jgi:hypothetical protein
MFLGFSFQINWSFALSSYCSLYRLGRRDFCKTSKINLETKQSYLKELYGTNENSRASKRIFSMQIYRTWEVLAD